MNNIGLLLFSQGDFANSKPLFEKAIKIKSDSFGEDHISTASSQHNLAILLHKMKRFTEAEALYAKALEVRTENLGPEHPDTRATADNMNSLTIDKDRVGAKLNRLAASYANTGAMRASQKLVDDELDMDHKYLKGSKNMSRTHTPKRAFRDDDSREVWDAGAEAPTGEGGGDDDLSFMS